MSEFLLISDAAKEVEVESHVLRYWEEELELPIKRNELGHRYYTEEDVQRFRQIKHLKERGLQLKAIKMIMKDGKLDVIGGSAYIVPEKGTDEGEEHSGMNIEILECRDRSDMMEKTVDLGELTREEKAKRLQWIIQQMMQEAVKQNNQTLCKEIKESVIKELDYQFRMQEEREEERDKELVKRGEEYYHRMDELLRKKARRRVVKVTKAESPAQGEGPEEKKKRHFIF